jgi:hypothetical protein
MDLWIFPGLTLPKHRFSSLEPRRKPQKDKGRGFGDPIAIE